MEEEQLVAELELLGIRYLSRRTSERAERVRPPAALLADLVRQPSARVRAAVIAVLLAHPEYAAALPAALERLPLAERQTLRFAAARGLAAAARPVHGGSGPAGYRLAPQTAGGLGGATPAADPDRGQLGRNV